MKERIVVGMSGGVDSSVAAALSVEQGHDVVGVTMRVWPWQDGRGADEPVRELLRHGGHRRCAPRSPGALGIPHYLLNMDEEFDRKVIEPFADAYGAGRTPVPCVACNSELKFGSLLGRARAWDAAAVATGHYARIDARSGDGPPSALRGRDARKDQTDFLWPLTQAQLARGALSGGRPHQGRGAGARAPPRPGHGRQAREPGDLLRPGRRLPGIPAPARARRCSGRARSSTADGRVLGTHAGVAGYTIGQRRGPRARRRAAPLYVVDLDPDTRHGHGRRRRWTSTRDRARGRRGSTSSRARRPRTAAACRGQDPPQPRAGRRDRAGCSSRKPGRGRLRHAQRADHPRPVGGLVPGRRRGRAAASSRARPERPDVDTGRD